MKTKTYSRSKEQHKTATEAWDDIVSRSDRVHSFDQYRGRDHTATEWRFNVRVEE